MRKPGKCLECGSRNVVDILYGYPINSPDLMEKIKQGKIVLGGCVITGNDPAWKCTECGAEIFSDVTDSENAGA